MELFEAIAMRHSYRGAFTDRAISREELTKIVQAGIQAPSGKNAQTTTFVIVDDPALIKQIGDITEKDVVRCAKAIIVCLAEHKPTYEGFSFGVEDCAAAVENILLAITAMGFATVWVDGNIRLKERNRRIEKLLGVPQGREARIILPVGEPRDKVAQAPKKPFSERAWFNKHG